MLLSRGFGRSGLVSRARRPRPPPPCHEATFAGPYPARLVVVGLGGNHRALRLFRRLFRFPVRTLGRRVLQWLILSGAPRLSFDDPTIPLLRVFVKAKLHTFAQSQSRIVTAIMFHTTLGLSSGCASGRNLQRRLPVRVAQRRPELEVLVPPGRPRRLEEPQPRQRHARTGPPRLLLLLGFRRRPLLQHEPRHVLKRRTALSLPLDVRHCVKLPSFVSRGEMETLSHIG